MSEVKGTKGKWELGRFITHGSEWSVSVNNASIDVWSGINCVTDEEANANALLISKAPEMLAMLYKLLKALDEVELSCDTTEIIVPLMEEAEILIKEATEI